MQMTQRWALGRAVARNPAFVARGGRVSVVGHSLGSVIAFDLLCGATTAESASVATASVDDSPAVQKVCSSPARARRPGI